MKKGSYFQSNIEIKDSGIWLVIMPAFAEVVTHLNIEKAHLCFTSVI